MEQQKDFICLPSLYDTWPRLKGDLHAIATKEAKGLEALEEVLERNGYPGGVSLLRNVLKKEDHFTTDHFCAVQLPWLAQKALQIEDLFKCSEFKLQNLKAAQEGEVVLTRQQICCLLALSFFNSFKEPLTDGYQEFSLAGFLTFAMSASQGNKLLCLLNYFERIRQNEEAKDEEFLSLCVSVTRRRLNPADANGASWEGCSEPLVPFESLSEGLIEDAHGCLQVDFANAYIGGGVLGLGNVQEEIRFVINPECLVSILLCERMEELESILITGAEQFSSYTGYGGRFTYAGSYADTNPVDECKRRCVSIVAIDAIPFMYSGSETQFQRQGILRELNKAYSGFSCKAVGDSSPAGNLIPVATGNWGCGAFGGDKHLKTLIQWLAASRVGRSVKYYIFDKNVEFSQKQTELATKLLSQKVTVGQLYQVLVSGIKKDDIFEHVGSLI